MTQATLAKTADAARLPEAYKILKNLADGMRLTASNVLEVAKKPSSPLHPYFVWDDTDAAHRYRLYQANQLIREFTIRVTKPEASGKPQQVKVAAFVRLGDFRQERPHMPRATVMRDHKAELIDKVVSSIEALLTRNADVAELEPIRRACERVRAGLAPKAAAAE